MVKKRKGGDGDAAGSKTSILMGLMARREGATSKEMQAAVGWEAHAVRGVIGGLKRRGMQIVVLKEKRKEAVYRLLNSPEPCAGK